MKWENGTTKGRKAELELIAIDRGRGPDDRDPESDHNHSPKNYFSSVSDCLTGRSPLGDLAIKKGLVAPGNVAMASADI